MNIVAGLINDLGVSMTFIPPPVIVAPTCEDDFIETVLNTPVVIDVLANDVAGTNAIDPASLVVVALPPHGTAEVADGQITYTPELGYSGIDAFVYQVSDVGNHTSDQATVVIDTDELPVPPTYTNGFNKRARIRVPLEHVAGGGTVSNFIMYVDITDNDLRTQMNGGEVVSDDGWDIRFESPQENKLPHRIISYDGESGRLRAFVRVTLNGASDTSRFIYLGKTGLEASEEDPVGLYAGYWAAWNCRTGFDYSGNGKHLVPTAVGSDTSLLGDAGDYNGTTSIMSAQLTGWNGATGATIQILHKLDADAVGDNRGIIKQGPANPAGTECGVALFTRSANAAETVTNPILGNIGATTTNAFTVGGTLQHTEDAEWLGMTWVSGQAPVIYKGGVALATSVTQVGTGTTQEKPANNGDKWWIGDGPVNTQFPKSGFYKGLLEEGRVLYDTVLSTNFMATESKNYLTPQLFYGRSSFDFSNTNQSPVAIPFTVDCLENGSVTIDVLFKCFDPDGDTITITDNGTPADGETVTTANKIVYTPTASFFGVDEFTYTISDGNGHTSSALVRVNVIEVDVPQPAGPYAFKYGLPWALPASNDDIVFINYPQTGTLNFPVGDNTTWNKVLVVVPPAGGITTGSSGNSKNMKWGGVIMIGFDYFRTGPTEVLGEAANQGPYKGGDFFNVSNNAGANALITPGRRPYWWISNMRVRMVNSLWGDFIRHGTNLVGDATNKADYHDFYFQKIKFDQGHLNWDTLSPPTSTQTHSDLMQGANGGTNHYYVNECEFVWNGLGLYTLDTGNILNKPNKTKSPQGARFFLEDVSIKPQPVGAGQVDDGTWRFHTQSRDVGVWNIADGLWRSFWPKNVKLWLPTTHPKFANPAAVFSTPNYPAPVNVTEGGRKFIRWTPVTSGGRTNGDFTVMEDCEVEMVATEAALPQMVNPAHTGAAVRITDVGTLRSVFGG
jgi:hypothetical protein